MTGRLEGKTALITGGASGIGEATVEKFVAEGARVMLADIQHDAGAAVAGRWDDDTVRFVPVDVCGEDDVAGAISDTVSAWGRLDCLFNNAGFGGVTGDVAETDTGEPYRRTLDALLSGPLYGMKHAAPIMREQGTGAIVTTASIAGTGGGYGPHVYSALKSAVINLTRSVAQELGPAGIRVNAVCPGFINTPIFLGQLALEKDSTEALSTLRELASLAQPITRAGLPADIANAVAFLASDEASFITGQPLVVDGGMTLGAWQHPDLGDGGIAQALEAVTGKPADEVDMVYHARSDS